MFKVGDAALVRSSGEMVEILDVETFLVRRNAGEAFLSSESDLQMAHPSCLGTMQGKNPYEENWLSREPDPDRLSCKQRDKLEEKLKDLPKDINGHWQNGTMLRNGFAEDRIFNLLTATRDITKDQYNLLLAAMAPEAEPLSEWISLGDSLCTNDCSCCGLEELSLETNGKVIRIAGASCPFPTGLPLTEWELNVPSGKIAVANDLREYFPLPYGEGEIPSINTQRGCRETTLAYARIGMSHAFVGNTCPRIYKVFKQNQFKIASAPSAPFEGEKTKGRRVGSICTDLWWYSICDSDELAKRVAKFGDPEEFPAVDYIKVKPGVYRFRHKEGSSHSEARTVTYSVFEWVRNPDPVQDFIGTYDAIDVTAHAYVQAQVNLWPTLFGGVNKHKDKIPWSSMTEKQRINAWKSVANHIFCVNGGGTEWHEKGFPTARVDPTIPDIDPPEFREQLYWYPFSMNYGGLFKSVSLSASFAKLAFRVLESCISFGMSVRDNSHSREVNSTRQRMHLALKRYRELITQHPDVADKTYAAWVNDGDRADKWIERFDLGPVKTSKHIKHVEMQRWFPTDETGYGVVFDARLLSKSGGFAWHPKNPGCAGCWASKENAQCVAIERFEDNGQEGEDNCFWSSNAGKSVPLYSVARVVRTGTVSHTGDTIIEIAYDYGSDFMRSSSRIGLKEMECKIALHPLTKEEYETLLPEAIAFYDSLEAMIAAKCR